ncbi:coiled-coil domain-containing protein mad1 [Borealophlyctis nickersoniae]|nr:coiled-coil domain-containing protein mad1 [Borealophlyctis nickersoniae]
MFHPYAPKSPRKAGSPQTPRGPNPAGSLSRSTLRPGNSFRPSASSQQRTPDFLKDFDSYLKETEQSSSPSTSQHLSSSTFTDSISPLKRSVASTRSNISTVAEFYADQELEEARREARTLKESKRKLLDEKTKLEKVVIELERKNDDLEMKRQDDQRKLETLEADRKFLFERSKDLKERLENAQSAASAAKLEADRQIAALTKENERLKETGQRAVRDARDMLKSKDLTLKEALSAKEFMSKQMEQLTLQAQRSSESAQAKQEQLDLAHQKLSDAELTISRLRSQGNDQEEMAILRKQTAEQSEYIKQLEGKFQQATQENIYFRSVQENVEKLREENRAAERQLSVMSQLRQRLAGLEVEVATLRAEKVKWVKFLEERDDTGIDSPYALSKKLAQHRLEVATLRDKLGEEMSKKSGREARISRLEQEVKELADKRKEAEEKYEVLSRNHKRLEKGRALLQKETVFLREQLNSYDMEEATLMEGNYDAQKTKRIEELEALLDECKRHIEMLERQEGGPPQVLVSTSLSSGGGEYESRNSSSELLQKLDEYEEEIGKLKSEKALLEKEVGSLDEQVGELERAIGRGEYDSSTTKILQLADNPESRELAIRQKTLDALRAENKSLKDQLLQRSRLRGVGEIPSNVEGLVPIETCRSLEVECEKLQGMLADKERIHMRLKEVYQSKVQEYRGAVYSLLGYKLEIQMDGRVRLTSMYESQDDISFLFSSSEHDQGTIQLLGAKSGALGENMRHYVNQRGSIPAFLASVTLGLFEARWSMEGTAMHSGGSDPYRRSF